MHFTSPTWGSLSIDQMMVHMKSYLEEQPDAQHVIVIGTDSQTSHEATTFVSAVVIHRVGKGARFFFRKQRSGPMFELRRRIYRETELSLQLVEAMNGKGLSALTARWPLEIHIDIGRQGDTKALIAEINGWVSSVGYVPRIKPESFGASAVADRFTS